MQPSPPSSWPPAHPASVVAGRHYVVDRSRRRMMRWPSPLSLLLGVPGLLLTAAAAVAGHTIAPLAVWTLVALGRAAWLGRRYGTPASYRQLRPRMLAEAAVVLCAVAAAALGLLTWGPPWLSAGWLDVLTIGSAPAAEAPAADTSGSIGASTVLLAPLAYRWLAVPALALLIYALPWLAWVEELVFRQGTRNWRHAVRRSLAFGLAHLPMGIPLGAALALSLAGLWLTAHYFRGGPVRSATYHLAYNTLAVTVVAVLILLP